MNRDRPISFTIRVFVAFASLGLLLFFMIQARTIINALFLSYIIVLSASPLLYWMLKKNFPGWLAFALTLLAIILVLGSLIVLLIVAFNRLVESIPTYASELQSIVDDFDQLLLDLGVEEGDISGVFTDMSQLFDPSVIFDAGIAFISGIVSAFSNIALIGLILVFLLVDAFGIAEKLSSEIKSGNDYIKRVAAFGADIRQYIYITTIVGIVTGIGDIIFFLLMGVDFAVLWGILAFLLSYIPTIGFWLAAIPPTILTLLEFGWPRALFVFLGIVLINGFAENVVKPKYMGRGLNLSPFVVVFSVIFWSAILGPIGAILSIPMTLIFKELIFEVDDQNRWIATLMSAGVSAVAPERLEMGEFDGEELEPPPEKRQA
ncbi:MAG: AI-2E family transporter [Anaerolineae bacterium]|nr:MAG: AI-2E family transporter [Anaerolineae bacterium]